MLLNSIKKNPQESLLYMERYVNNGSPSGFTWKNQPSKDTSPLYGQTFFLLSIISPKNTKGFFRTKTIGHIPQDVSSLMDEHEIFLHPDMSRIYKQKGFSLRESNVRVSPTSSSRTVKLCDYRGFIKLNYNGIIGRIDRSLTDKHAYCSVDLSSMLMQILADSSFSKLSMFPETGARFIIGDNANLGMVYRDDIPYGLAAGQIEYIIPLFSCFSKDHFKNDEYLIIQLIDNSDMDPKEYILTNIIFPIIDNYFNLVKNYGLQPEWHAQNLLIGIGRNFKVESLIMRDMESIDIDQSIRETLGVHSKLRFYPFKHINISDYNYQIKHSFMFDCKIGEYIFTPLISCVCTHYGLKESEIQHCIKEYVNIIIEDLPKNYFPENGDWFSFKNIIIDRSIPSRPYIRNSDCKYRS